MPWEEGGSHTQVWAGVVVGVGRVVGLGVGESYTGVGRGGGGGREGGGVGGRGGGQLGVMVVLMPSLYYYSSSKSSFFPSFMCVCDLQLANFPSPAEELQFYYQVVRKFHTYFQNQEVSSTLHVYDRPLEVYVMWTLTGARYSLLAGMIPSCFTQLTIML